MELKKKCMLVLYGVLAVVGIAISGFKLFTVQTSFQIAVSAVTLTLFVFAIICLFFIIKKNNLKLLSCLMLFYALSLIFDLNFANYYNAPICHVLTAIAMILVAFIAGNLSMSIINKVFCFVILACLIYVWIRTSMFFQTPIHSGLSQIILWINICLTGLICVKKN